MKTFIIACWLIALILAFNSLPAQTPKKRVLIQKIVDNRGLISVIYYDKKKRDTVALDYIRPRKFKRLFK